MSNAHASNTPHRIGQISKAELHIAHLLDTAPAGADHQRQATVIVQELQNLGWTAPPDPNADIPPLRPAHVGDLDGPGRQEFLAAKAALAARPRQP